MLVEGDFIQLECSHFTETGHGFCYFTCSGFLHRIAIQQ